jgi:hypothetical protein
VQQTPPASPEELARLGAVLERWLAEQVADNPVAEHWERIPGDERWWFLRLRGDEKDVYTVRWLLQQRTLHYETYFMPAPEENVAELYAHLLERNHKMYGGAFSIGEEGAIFLTGRLDRSLIEAEHLDRVLGSIYAWVEQYFKPAIKIGFASRFADDS